MGIWMPCSRRKLDGFRVARVHVAHHAVCRGRWSARAPGGWPRRRCHRRRRPCPRAANSQCQRRRHDAPTPRTRPIAVLSSALRMRPVGNGVGAIASSPSVSRYGRGDGAAIQVVAANDDGALQFAFAHQFIECQAELCALAIAQPADARGQALEVNLFAARRIQRASPSFSGKRSRTSSSVR